MPQKPLIVANWKSNKTVDEALRWLEEFHRKLKIENLKLGNVEIVICPPFPALRPLKLSIINYQLSIKLGAQDISPFPDGPYTGEVSARMLIGWVDYVLIGHSERRRFFGETTKSVGQKVKVSLNFDLIPIICAESFEQLPLIVRRADGLCVMYEPPSAISQKGVYLSERPENAQKVSALWKSKLKGRGHRFLYGGSVNPENVRSFLTQKDISGVVVGHASLSPQTFFEILKNAKV